ncbi:MAG TPA: hypothetical protein VF503_12435 [Sphingobium sp.]|uniref:hypothetical protein n=1 Tax=Sphingobium sp. TaxID=1912891 RepID=UPI002ED1B588
MTWDVQQPGKDALEQYRRSFSKRLTIAAARASEKAARGAKDDIRTAMCGQRLGGLANSVSSTSDRQKGRVRIQDVSILDVAGFVSVRGVKSPRTAGALRSYVDQDSTTISPVRGRWLSIPTKSIPSKIGRRKMTPERYRAGGLEQKLGPLQFVPSKKPGVAYLVINDVTVRNDGKGTVRPLPRSGKAAKERGHVTVIAFILIRVSRRSRRVSPQQIVDKWSRRLPALLNQELGSSAGSF